MEGYLNIRCESYKVSLSLVNAFFSLFYTIFVVRVPFVLQSYAATDVVVGVVVVVVATIRFHICNIVDEEDDEATSHHDIIVVVATAVAHCSLVLLHLATVSQSFIHI